MGWLIFGAVLALLLVSEVPTDRALLIGAIWAAGGLPLYRRDWADRIAVTANHLAAERASRIAILIVLAITVVMLWLLSPLGGLLVALPGSVALMVMALIASPQRVGSALVGSVMSVGILVVGLGAIEGVMRSSPIRRRWGGAAERARWERQYDRLWERNLFGLRSPYERVAKPAGARRIVAIGDSFTWGDKIAKTEDTWPSQLEADLEQAYPNTTIQVINFGQRGFTTYNENEELRRLGWQFGPDLVLVEFVANDALPSGPFFQREPEAWMSPPVRLLPDLFTRGAINHSALLAWVQDRLSTMGTPYHLRYLQLYREDSEGWQQMQAAIREIGDSTRARGVPAVYILHPIFVPGEWTVETYPLRSIHERVTTVASEAGLYVIDLAPVYAAQGGDWKRWWATPWDSHPGVEAHALTARVLAEYLRSERWAAALFEGGDPNHTEVKASGEG
ncbi:MAG TPA: SGNH/GDSL hydrolase family protein [Gemmatimonadaceae bacterium]|nr:SGNH/GDSL hydrolase family protein [Gemmatimonadaceae bacterium]